MVSLWDTVRSPTISPSLPMSLWKQRSSRLITAPRRIIRCDHRIQRWKSFTQWVSLTFLKRAQTVGSLFYWRYKWLLLSKSKVLPTLKLWWTENKQAQFMKKYNFHLHVTPLSWGQLQQHWWWTYPSRGKQGFLQILFYLLQSAVLSVLIQSAISLTIKPDVRRHGPSTGTESMPFRKCRIKIKKIPRKLRYADVWNSQSFIGKLLFFWVPFIFVTSKEMLF